MTWIEPLLTWYGSAARDLPWRRTRDAYAVWVSEIMLQQTRVTAVLPYYARWMAALPDVHALAKVDDEALHKLWEGLGYYSRARHLKEAAIAIEERFAGQVPLTYEELLTLPGVGDYTAGAVASIAGNQPVPAVDGNVLRVYARLYGDSRDVSDTKTRTAVREALLAILPNDRPGTFNQAMMELGATVCLPNGKPNCESCPVSPFCEGYRTGQAEALPVKKPKKQRRVEEKTVFALERDGAVLSLRRPETGLLAGLWQLPETEGLLTASQAAEQLARWGLTPVGDLLFYRRKHVFTHVEWHMQVCAAAVTGETLPPGWVPLKEEYALPTAYRVCMREDVPLSKGDS